VNKEPIRTFEKQSGLIRLLIYLLDNQPINVQSIIDNTDIYPNIMYSSLRKAKELNLIESTIDKSSYPSKNMISLTKKGKEIAKKLKEIEGMLS
jgi:DNA-binding MarR family transcriptional regulator